MKRSAFTLLESMIVVGITGVLVAITLPVISSAKLSGYKVQSSSTLRQLVQAQLLYASDHSSLFAVANTSSYSWHDQLSPYYPGVSSTHPPLFADPSRSRGPSGYVVNACVGYGAGQVDEPAKVILQYEFAATKTFHNGRSGEFAAYALFFPDSAVRELLELQRPGTSTNLLGTPASSKYRGVGLYAMLDGHVQLAAPTRLDFALDNPCLRTESASNLTFRVRSR